MGNQCCRETRVLSSMHPPPLPSAPEMPVQFDDYQQRQDHHSTGSGHAKVVGNAAASASHHRSSEQDAVDLYHLHQAPSTAPDTNLVARAAAIAFNALSCADYYRGVEGLFFCSGDSACPMLLQSGDVWGGAPMNSKEAAAIAQRLNKRMNRINTGGRIASAGGAPAAANSGKADSSFAFTPPGEASNNVATSNFGAAAAAAKASFALAEGTPTSAQHSGSCVPDYHSRVDHSADSSNNNNNCCSANTTSSSSTTATASSSAAVVAGPAVRNSADSSAFVGGSIDVASKRFVYTADSCPCRAARHAGAIGRVGGLFSVVLLPGQEAYEGSCRNGIVSRSHGWYDMAIGVAAVQVSCAAQDL